MGRRFARHCRSSIVAKTGKTSRGKETAIGKISQIRGEGFLIVGLMTAKWYWHQQT
jgi:hypothetical protein